MKNWLQLSDTTSQRLVLSTNANEEYLSNPMLVEPEHDDRQPPEDDYDSHHQLKTNSDTLRNSRMSVSPRSQSSLQTCCMNIFSCDDATDFYNSILGPTADEAILGGFRMLTNFCKKFKCDQNEEERQITSYEPPEMSSKCVGTESICLKSSPEILTDMLSSVGVPSKIASDLVESSLQELQKSAPELVSKILQTSNVEMVSKILQTIGFTPEMAERIVQTSLETLQVKEDRPIMEDKLQQTSACEMTAVTMQTSLPDVHSEFAQTIQPSAHLMFTQTSFVEKPVILSEPSSVSIKETEILPKKSFSRPKVSSISLKDEPSTECCGCRCTAGTCCRCSEEEIPVREPPPCACYRTCPAQQPLLDVSSRTRGTSNTSHWCPEVQTEKMCICCRKVVPDGEEVADGEDDEEGYFGHGSDYPCEEIFPSRVCPCRGSPIMVICQKSRICHENGPRNKPKRFRKCCPAYGRGDPCCKVTSSFDGC